VAIDASGRYAYVANNGGNNVSQYTIGADGSLSPMSTAAVAAGTNPQAVASTLGQVCVRCEQWRQCLAVHDRRGRLARPHVRRRRRRGPESSVPRRRPHGQICLRREQSGNSVSQYAIGTDGSLASIAADVAAGTGPQSIAADPSGGYVYAANITSGNVSQYAIGTDGSLTPIASIAAGSSPQSVSVDASGHHVYVANRGSSTVSIYAIGANGSLTASTPSFVPSQNARSRSR